MRHVRFNTQVIVGIVLLALFTLLVLSTLPDPEHNPFMLPARNVAGARGVSESAGRELPDQVTCWQER